VLKTLISQLVYESASTALYLALQEGARGGGVRSALDEVRGKFWRAWTSGLAFFSVTHSIMFLAPLWWMQPVIDNLSSLGEGSHSSTDVDCRARAPGPSHHLPQACQLPSPLMAGREPRRPPSCQSVTPRRFRAHANGMCDTCAGAAFNTYLAMLSYEEPRVPGGQNAPTDATDATSTSSSAGRPRACHAHAGRRLEAEPGCGELR